MFTSIDTIDASVISHFRVFTELKSVVPTSPDMRGSTVLALIWNDQILLLHSGPGASCNAKL